MAPELDDELWNLIEPLLPRTIRRYRHPGRRRIDDRKVLSRILFVLSTGIASESRPFSPNATPGTDRTSAANAGSSSGRSPG